ncbi:MAG: nucleotidyltransferase family protein [Deltaproteobacteria bacterium]|jgi:predicted nucleotidyltransferase
MGKTLNINVPHDKIAVFCKLNHIRKLSLFGSVLREDFRPDSDVDVLVEFEEGHVPGLLRFIGMKNELSVIIAHEVDLRTPAELSRYFRDEVVSSAQVEYVER